MSSQELIVSEASGFLSYARSDDENERGRISELRDRLAAEVQMQTGRIFPIFQDREDIAAGRRWWSFIEESLASTRLLIAIITPSFLVSDTCREEVRLFSAREKALGCDELIIPVLYVATPQLYNFDDEIARDLLERNYFDWVDLRFEDSNTNTYRKGIASLAGQVVDAIEQSTVKIGSGDAVEESSDDFGAVSDDEDDAGYLEVLADSEEALPQFVESMESVTNRLHEVTSIVEQATRELIEANSSGKPASAKLAVTIRLSGRLEKPVHEIEQLADDYVRNLKRVDSGVHAIISRLSMKDQTHDQESARGLLDAMTELSDKAGTAFDTMEESRQSMIGNYSLSSNLRPILKRMSTSMLKIMRSRDMFEAWRDDLANVLDGNTE